jgi:molybdopterin/thiamine biosynthesis adenylyltransferase
MTADDRYSRNELLFGAEGQKRIAGARVGVVGLGGLGSHVGQQLAYLGVLDYVLVDDDAVSGSSLNRLVGARVGDVGAPKVVVAERLITAVQPSASIVTVEHGLPAPKTLKALSDRTHIIGCVDREAPRLQLTDLSSQERIIYIDTATDVEMDGEYGGRIVVAAGGNGCLFCLGQIDQEELRREQMTPEQRHVHDATYGIDQGALHGAGPSVVSLNGVVASLAINEFMVSVTEMGDPAGHLIYRARSRRLTRSIDSPSPTCPYCGRW